MKTVKFNVTSAVHMIPDEVYAARQAEFKKMRYENPTKFREYMMAGDEYPVISVRIGEIIEVPNWYFAANKDRMIEIPHDSKFAYRNGNAIPFSSTEAAKWDRETILKDKVNLFTLVVNKPENSKAA